MKRLLIFRHAKAGRHDEAHDKERALVERGRSDAALMGRQMRDRGYLPDLVLCSSAKRTTETWGYAAPSLGANPDVAYLDELYDASGKAILKAIRGVRANIAALMYIGHNPGLEDIACELARKSDDDAERKRVAAMTKKFPTSAVAVIDFDVNDWAAIGPGEGMLSDFLTPSDLRAH